MNRQVERIVRTLDLKAAQVHMRRTTDAPFVAAPSEVNGRMYSGNEDALIALHKMRTRMGSPAEIEAGKAWLRVQGLNGLFGADALGGGTVYAFIVGFNEWVLKAGLPARVGRATRARMPTVGNMTVRSSAKLRRPWPA
jgi:hypothetical protein